MMFYLEFIRSFIRILDNKLFGGFMKKLWIKIGVVVLLCIAAIALVATGTAADVAASIMTLIPRIFAGG